MNNLIKFSLFFLNFVKIVFFLTIFMILILILIIHLFFLIGYQNTKHWFSQKNKDFSNFPKFSYLNFNNSSFWIAGEFKWCNSHVTAYISVLKFLQVSVKNITRFKTVIALHMPVLFFKHCHSVESIDSINVDTDPTDPIRSVWSG